MSTAGVLMHADLLSHTPACHHLHETSPPLQTQASRMIRFKPFSSHVNVIPFHRSPRKRYMQYFYQQFRLCHRNHYGESFLLAFSLIFLCVDVLSVPQTAGPPVNVTCNIFINSFGSIAETTMVSGALQMLEMFC